MAIFLLAWTVATLSLPDSSVANISSLMKNSREHLSLRGIVAYEPVQYNSSCESEKINCYFPLEVDGVLRSDGWHKASGKVRVRLKMKRNSSIVRYGDYLEMDGLLLRQSEGGVFSRRRPPLFRVAVGDSTLVSSGNASRVLSLCLRTRRAAAAVLTRGIESYPRQAALLKALLLGYREELDRDTYNCFTMTGTVHILAISGLHVGLIAGIIIFLLRAVGLPRTRWFLFLVPLLVFYTISTGLRASAMRACLMAVVYWSAPALKRKPDALCALAVTAILILLVCPGEVMDPGFQFSFLIVAGIILILPVATSLTGGFLESDPWRVQGESRWILFLRANAKRAYLLVALTVAAWIISAPLVIFYGNLFSPIALVGNLLVVPLAGVIVSIGCMSLLSGAAVGLFAEIFNHANRLFLTLLLNVTEAMATMPAGHLFVETPPWWIIPIYYILLWRLFASRKLLSRVVSFSGLLAFVLFFIYASDREPTHADIRQLAECTCMRLDLRRGTDVLVNCGSRYTARDLKRWLRSEGVNRLRLLVLTQVDSRHVGAFSELIASVRIDEIWIPEYRNRSPVYAELFKIAARQDVPIKTLSHSLPRQLADGVELEVFSPALKTEYASGAEAAMVFRLARGPRAAIFVGSEQIPPGLFEQPKDIEAPVWIIEGGRRPAAVSREILMRKSQTIVVGGIVEKECGVWSLDQDGAFDMTL